MGPAVTAAGPVAGSSVSAPAPDGATSDAGSAPAAAITAAPVDARSGEGLLRSLAAAPPSAFAATLMSAKGTVGAIQSREREQLRESLPQIEQPTGLPVRVAASAAPVPDLGSRAPPGRTAVDVARASASRAGSQRVRPSMTTTVAPAPGAGDGGDSGVVIDAGPVPQVDLTGDADPAHSAEAEQAAQAQVTEVRTAADQATRASFGELDVAPTVARQTLRPTRVLKGPPAADANGAGRGSSPSIPAEMLAEFDAAAAPKLAAQVQGHAGRYAKRQADYESTVEATQRDGQRQIAEATAATRTEQEGMRADVRADVDGERRRWQQDNAKIAERFGTQAGSRRREVERDINAKVQSTHEQAASKLTDAEQEAGAAKKQAEKEAKEKADEAKDDKPKSTFGKLTGAVKSVAKSAFDAVRSVVKSIFDRLRQVVRTIIEGAKRLVHGLIEAARRVIVTLITAFGEFVKGLVSVLLIAFPELAKRARAWIDRRIKQAVDAVNHQAEKLKQLVSKALDVLANALARALSALQGALIVALNGLEALANAFLDAMAFLQRLAAWLAQNENFLKGLQLLKDKAATVIDAIREAIGEMIDSAIAAAKRGVDELSSRLGPRGRKHLAGIWRHLTQALAYLRDNWWATIKETSWLLLWPLPTVFDDIGHVVRGISACVKAAGKGQLSAAIDQFLEIGQKVNDIVGNLAGWFAIASVLIGAIIGAFFGGVGALPGAWAGAQFAATVGEGLDAAFLVVEAGVVAKSVADLYRDKNSEDEDEEDYNKIAGSGLGVAIVAAMTVIPAVGGRFAKRIKDAFPRPPKPTKLRPDTPDVPKTPDTPDAPKTPDAPDVPNTRRSPDAPDGKAPESSEGETASGESSEAGPDGGPNVKDRPSADKGHTLKILGDGRVFVCSQCTPIEVKYEVELQHRPELRRELYDAISRKDPDAIAAVESKLATERTRLDMVNRVISQLERLRNHPFGSPEHKAWAWVKYQIINHHAPKTPEFDPTWSRQYDQIVTNKRVGSTFETAALAHWGKPENKAVMMPPDGGPGFIPDSVRGSPTELIPGEPYDFTEVKSWASMSKTGNLAAMLNYVDKYGGHITVILRSSKPPPSLSGPLQALLAKLRRERKAKIFLYP
jgi:hypothetical protein